MFWDFIEQSEHACIHWAGTLNKLRQQKSEQQLTHTQTTHSPADRLPEREHVWINQWHVWALTDALVQKSWITAALNFLQYSHPISRLIDFYRSIDLTVNNMECWWKTLPAVLELLPAVCSIDLFRSERLILGQAVCCTRSLITWQSTNPTQLTCYDHSKSMCGLIPTQKWTWTLL